MNKESLKELLDKYLAGNCTPAEKVLIERFYMDESLKGVIPSDITDPIEKKAETWSAITKHIDDLPEKLQKGSKYVFLKRVGYAAALLIILFAGLFYYQPSDKQNLAGKTGISKVDVKPGGNKAILTLSDGRSVVLNDTKEGIVATQSGLSIKKTKNGQLIYVADAGYKSRGHSENKSEVMYNTITTPRGGSYQVNLPDGTRVWLNAASSLRFPTQFPGKERSVQLKGEAYFEVAKNKAKQFIVKTGIQTVTVLGTHFNINAYQDEAVYNTTLLEGSVNISNGNDNRLLKPGEQASVSADTRQIKISSVDIEEAVAWKNNKISFTSQPLEKIMRQISRWYNVDIVYKGNISAKTFTGTISRYANVSEVLDMLELTDLVHFKIEEGRITVMP
jgi:transmembrane sensor